ncbi:Alpha/Beta hydrolase protein [Schizophyllum commune]
MPPSLSNSPSPNPSPPTPHASNPFSRPTTNSSSTTTANSTISWSSCTTLDWRYAIGDPLNITCGFFEVPLDYADGSIGTAKLAVARYPAQGERKGTVFVNPGGPGGSGVEFVLGYGPDLSTMVGGGYDVVSWDPRGVGHTEPGAPECLSDDEWTALFSGTLETQGLDIKGNLTDGDQVEQFDSHVDEMEAKYQTLGQKCAESSATLPYLGTAAAARDMVALADYLDPDIQEINYWGFSYGSMLGFVFVNMFPDRVGHVVLDGCMNPLLYANKPTTEYYPNDVVDADEAFAGFATACALAGPGSCSLAKNGTDASEDIKERVKGMLDLAHTLAASGADLSSTMTSGQARTYLFEALAEPTSWASLAAYLEAYEEKLEGLAANSTNSSTSSPNSSTNSTNSSTNSTNRSTAARGLSENRATHGHSWRLPKSDLASFFQSDDDEHHNKRQVAPSEPHTYEFEAIYCGDGVDADFISADSQFNMSMKSGFDAITYAASNVSALFGPQWGAQGNLCFAWPARAVERYTGPWDGVLKSRVLVIGNTADPVTPFENAQLMANLVGDSAVLVRQNGFGHASLAEKSSCTIGVVSRYFQNGEATNSAPQLPTGDDTVCEIDDDVVLFPNSNVTQARVRAKMLAALAA